jgi:hypothetical protein
MTIEVTLEELATRYHFDPKPGTVHIHDLISKAKDGLYVKDRTSE